MREGIDVDRVLDDLWMSRPARVLHYDYITDGRSDLFVALRDADGYITGTQAVTVTLGGVKPFEAPHD